MTELSHRSKRRIILGVGSLFVLLAVGVFLFAFFMLSAERAQLDGLTPLPSGQTSHLRLKQPILITTTISEKNPLLVHDLVVACEESQDPDGRSWHPKKRFHRPLLVTHDGVELVVTLRQPCPRGSYKVIPNPESNLWRWVGLRRGDTLTIIGTVISMSPLKLHGEHAFGGSVEDYRSYLTRGRWYAVPFSVFCLLVGAVLFVSARRRSASSRRPPR